MIDPPRKIPLLRSLGWSAQWAIAVALRHPLPMTAYMAGGVAAGLAGAVSPGSGAFAFLLYSLACIPLALLTHAEVLRGPSAFDARTLGQGPGRMLGYLLDTILIGIAAMLCALVPVIVIGVIASSGGRPAPGGGLEVVLVVLILAAVAVAASRPALRLPSRVLGPRVSWGEAWRLGRGSTLALVLGPFLISLPVYLVERVAEAVLPTGGGDVAGMVLMPVQVVLTCAFLSVAYGQLKPPQGPG